jgi:hypothetical protein
MLPETSRHQAPPTPIHPSLYHSLGYPFFKIYKEPSDIKDDFKDIKSVAELDKTKGRQRSHEAEKELIFPVVKLHKIDKTARFLPVAQMEEALKNFRAVTNF